MGPRSDEHGAGVGARPEARADGDAGADLARRATPHRLERLRPGFVRVALDGPVSAAQAQAILDFGREQATGQPPRVDVLAAVGGVGPVPGDARRVFRRGLATLPVRAVAVVGLGGAARLAARVFFRSLRLARDVGIPGVPTPFEARFFRDEGDARRWLEG